MAAPSSESPLNSAEQPARAEGLQDLSRLTTYFSHSRYRFVQAARVADLSITELPKVEQFSETLRDLFTRGVLTEADRRSAFEAQFGAWIITLDKIPRGLGRMFGHRAERLRFIGQEKNWQPFPLPADAEKISTAGHAVPKNVLYHFWKEHCAKRRSE